MAEPADMILPMLREMRAENDASREVLTRLTVANARSLDGSSFKQALRPTAF